MHILYLVGTPIGNLEDITPRALRILRRVGLIAAENPTRTQRLLARYGISTPMTRFTDAYDRKKAPRLRVVLDALRRTDVAYVSEAGMPLLSDPGYELVRSVIERGGEVVSIPGPTALAAALLISGLPTIPFLFLGFPPRKAAARRRLFAGLAGDERTLVLYESPNRLVATLRDAHATLGVRPVAVCCELTKLYEEVWRGDLGAAADHFASHPPRGEFTLVIGGANSSGVTK